MRRQPTHEGFDRTIARIAARRYGVLTLDQVLRARGTPSMVRDRIASGRWERMHRGVYRLAGTRPSPEQAAMAASLATGPDSSVSHLTAAGLWRFERISPTGLHVRSARRARFDGLTWHRGYDVHDRTFIGPIPVTKVERTLIDIAPMVTVGHLEIALDDCLRRGIARIERLQSRLEALGGSGRSGVGVLRMLVGRRVGVAVPESVFETMLSRVVLDLGLPEPTRQCVVRDEGRVVARVDLAYPDAKVAIEADGRRNHEQASDWEHDLARRNRLTELGWLVIHVTWRALVDRPDEVGATIARALASRRGSKRATWS